MKFASNAAFLKIDPQQDNDQLSLSRLDENYLKKRLGLEEQFKNPNLVKKFSISSLLKPKKCLTRFFKMAGLYHKGLANSFALNLNENNVLLKRLPRKFNGFKILHLSDLHLDMHKYYIEVLKQSLRRLDYDICVITGDFFSHYKKESRQHDCLLNELFNVLSDQVYVVLGNHDSIDMLPTLENIGYKVLINEAVHINRENQSIILSGVDDPHLFRLNDFKYYRSIDRTKCSVLLAHSPEIYKQAAYLGIDLYLCGHTHGGQICLPGGFPIVTHTRCPRKMVKGSWKYNDLVGYTSSGSGVSYLPIRFHSKPEICIHHLKSF